MAENTQVLRPSAGQSSIVPVGPDARLEFAFNQGEANLSKEGQHLVFTFNDGAKLTLEGFYDNFGEGAKPPTLIVQGNELPGEAFLAALNNPDLMPAAGPGAVLGGGHYEDAVLSGVDGLGDALGALDFDGWTTGAGVIAAAGGAGAAGVATDGAGGGGGEGTTLAAYPNVTQDWKIGDRAVIEEGFWKTQEEFPGAGGIIVSNVDVASIADSVYAGFKDFVEGDQVPSGFDKWGSGGKASAAVYESPVIDGGDSGTINVSWSMEPNNSGNQQGNVLDISVAMLFKVMGMDTGGKPILELVDGSARLLMYAEADPATGKQVGKGSPEPISGDVNWLVDPNEEYVVKIALVADGNGQKSNLSVNELFYIYDEPKWVDHVYEDSFALTCMGNVIFDRNPADGLADSHSEGLAMSVVSFVLEGVTYAVGEVVPPFFYQGNEASFTMHADGEYTFTLKVPGEMPPSIDDLNISYTIKSTDGLEATSDLFIRTDGNETFNVGSGNHTIYGGGGEDTFVYALLSSFGPSTDHIKDWNEGDKLQFDDLFQGGGTLSDLLSNVQSIGPDTYSGTSGDTSITLAIGVDHATLTVSEAGNSKTIVMEGYDFSSVSDDTAAQALLNQIIVTT